MGSGVVDKLGGSHRYELDSRRRIPLRECLGGKTEQTAPFLVLSTESDPNLPIYSSQHLHVGLNYVTIRDGISVAQPFGSHLERHSPTDHFPP